MKIIGLHLPYSLLIPIAIGRETVGLFFLLMLSFSCGKDKVIQLPEINHSEITEISDVSAAYLFYDETKADSVELNRKNLISSTNWLVNVDKRLTLKQAIPHIKFLQEKKNASSHKNENSKNYFTCSDLSRKNLGFVEFTDVVYSQEENCNVLSRKSKIKKTTTALISFQSINDIQIMYLSNEPIFKTLNIKALKDDIAETYNTQNNLIELILDFDEGLLFQDYISIKSTLSELNSENIIISKEELIYN